jgi:hypothetical protein
MRPALVRAIPVLLLANLGCGSSTLPSEQTLRVEPASREVTPGYDLKLTFENNSSAEVGVGELSCTSVLQRQTPNGWVDADELRGCPKPLHPVPAGGTYAFHRTMPSISGTFRLAVSASQQGETPRPTLLVYSPGIEVRWPPDLHGDLAAVVTIREVAPAADLAVRFENRSARQVAVGELSCVTEFELKTAQGWQRISPLRLCIELLRLVDGGSSFGYVTPAPETPGTYRVIFRAFPTGESGAVDVRSGEFEVTAP